MKATLALANGMIFEGKAFGHEGEMIGEIVFNTGMTGYQEILTDPSYAGQIVTMTYPLIGNYGLNADDFESRKPFVRGFIVREHCEHPSNWRSEMSIDKYLKDNNIIGIYGIDTRALTRVLRDNGTMNGIISTHPDFKLEEHLEAIKAYRIINPVDEVTCEAPVHYKGDGFKVTVVDLGAKQNIVRCLQKRGCAVTVLPSHASVEEILKDAPHGIMLTNGPGDPKDCVEIIQNIRQLMDKNVPIFGICLGHQLTALANGADSERLKYGHRGGNHPVKDLALDRTYITSQNHGYAIKASSVREDVADISHINMNDQTVEGLRYKNRPVFTVQFHPEASPGPMDTAYLFDDFMNMMKKHWEAK